MIELLEFGALVLGLTQAVKRAGLNPRYIPLVAIGIGILLSFTGAILAHVPFDLTYLLRGIIGGLSAVGLWSGTKNTIG